MTQIVILSKIILFIVHFILGENKSKCVFCSEICKFICKWCWWKFPFFFCFQLNNDLSENERIADNTAMKLITEKLRTFQAYEALPLTRPMFNKQKQFFLHLVQGIHLLRASNFTQLTYFWFVGICQQMKVTDFMVNAYENSILPPQLRVESFLGNSKMFLESYNCQPSSVMARFNRSLQFPYL